MISGGAPPPPGEWHPAYSRYDGLVAWVETGTFAGTRHDHLRVPRPAPARFSRAALEALDPLPEPWLLYRRKAWAPAPYVGLPFVYTWWVATDQLDRHLCAAEADISYVDAPFAESSAWHPGMLGPHRDF